MRSFDQSEFFAEIRSLYKDANNNCLGSWLEKIRFEIRREVIAGKLTVAVPSYVRESLYNSLANEGFECSLHSEEMVGGSYTHYLAIRWA